MSLLSKSLEKRIQELRLSLEAQKTELAAYQQVLDLESGQTGKTSSPSVVTSPRATAKAVLSAPDFKGNRSDFVAAILQQRGAAGATPAEISQIFAQKKIKFSKNLIYNVVSLLFKNKTISKKDGRYYYRGQGPAAPAKAAPAKKRASGKKRRISPEGIQRIVEATKKRWAAHRAAQAKKA